VRGRPAENTFSKGLEGASPSKDSGYALQTTLSNRDRTADISYFSVIRRRDENVAKSGVLFFSGNLQRESMK
jgi:hypothetical protein